MTQVVAYLEAVVGADITSFRRGMQEVRRETGVLSDDFTGMAGQLNKIGQGMTYAITAPLLAIGSSVVNVAGSFDAEMRNINAISHLPEEQLKSLSDRVLEFGMNSRSGANEAAKAMYQIRSAGIEGEASFSLMTQAVKMSEAGLSNLSDTTIALTSTVLGYSSQALDAAHASDVWLALVQQGIGELPDFTANMQKVTPIAAMLGLTFDNVAANIAYLSQQSGDGSKAVTAMSQALSNVLKPTESMKNAFAKLGVTTGKELIEKFGSLEVAIKKIHDVSSEIDFASMFSKTGIQYAGVVATNFDELTASVKKFGEITDGATNAAWEEQMKSYPAIADRFSSSIEALQIALGSQLLPILVSIITPLTTFFISLAKTNPEILKLVVAFGIAAAAAGPLIWIFSSLLSPIGLIMGAVAALSVAFASNFGGIRDTVISALGAAKAVIDPFIEVVKALWEVISGTGVSLENAERGNLIDDFMKKVDEQLSAAPTATAREITIPVKAGMTLNELYYNSEWSKDLQSKFSYDEFLKEAKTQIKGGDPRWLQVGQSLVFQLGLGVQVTPGERDMKDTKTPITAAVAKYKIEFQLLKDEIQKQYDFVFKGKPLVNAEGVDISGDLPVLTTLKNVIEKVKIVVDSWKDAFGVTLNNIRDGISGFFAAFQGKDYSGLVKVWATALDIVTGVWAVVNIIGSKILIWAGDLLKDTLPKIGTVIADFIQVISNIASGNFSIGNLDQLILDIANVIGTIVDKILGGKGFDAAAGLTAFAEDIRTALMLLTYVLQTGWRDAKIWMNTGVSNFLSGLMEAVTSLHDAHLISDEQFLSFKISTNNLKIDTQGAEFAKAIEDALKTGGGFNSNINIGSDNLKMVVQMGGAKAIADNLTVIGKSNLMLAIKEALASGDKNGVLSVLMPIAIAGDLDTSKMDFSKLDADAKAAQAKSLAGGTYETGTDTTSIGMTDAGKAIIDGLLKGITDNSDSLVTGVNGSVLDVQNAFLEGFQVKSPSRWTMGVGANLIAGFVLSFLLGGIVLAIASTMLANAGVKIPIANTLSPAWAKGVTAGVGANMALGLYEGLPSLVLATLAVIGAMLTMETGVLAVGNDLANKMQTIVDRITGQLNALKTAILNATNLTVPTTPTGGQTPTETATGTGTTATSKDSGLFLNIQPKSNVIPNNTINEAMRSTTNNSNSGGNTIVVNGVQDVDKLLFELKRRGINLAK